MQTIIISESDYNEYYGVNWEKSVTIIHWEHDFEKQIYTIKFKDE